MSIDQVIAAGFSAEDSQKARAMVDSFREYIETHHDKIAALQIIYNQPYGNQYLTFQQVRELAERAGTAAA